jgi:REP-associated tyrosine transposase
MPRANRYWLPGHVWHLTHRCHRRQFLLRFGRDRRMWTMWLYEARVRHGLCVLNYIVTSNHVHLVVRDRGRGEVAASMQLLEGCTGQAYNRRKERLGAFWQDRYHATAVESGEHLARCIVYVDLNMVRAGVVAHPRQWTAGGYREIQGQRRRYRIVDRTALAQALEVDVDKLAEVHGRWIDEALGRPLTRQPEWSESVAVGGRSFAERVLRDLGGRARDRRVEPFDGAYVVREPSLAYAAYFAPENVR